MLSVWNYVVRGFARNKRNEKVFMDHDMTSITKYVSPMILRDYDTFDKNSPEHHTFQTIFCRRELDESSYFRNPRTVPPDVAAEKMILIRKEMDSVARLIK